MLEILRSAQDDIGSAPAVFEKIDSPYQGGGTHARNTALTVAAVLTFAVLGAINLPHGL